MGNRSTTIREWSTKRRQAVQPATGRAPGPLAAQLGIYLGFVHYRVRGAALAGLTFALPSFFMVVAWRWAYVHFGRIPWMQAVFYGVGAAVIGIIAMSAKKLTGKSVSKDKLLWAIYLLLAIVAIITILTEHKSLGCSLPPASSPGSCGRRPPFSAGGR